MFICFSYLCRISEMKLLFQNFNRTTSAMNGCAEAANRNVHTFSKCDRFRCRCVNWTTRIFFPARILLLLLLLANLALSIKLNWTGFPLRLSFSACYTQCCYHVCHSFHHFCGELERANQSRKNKLVLNLMPLPHFPIGYYWIILTEIPAISSHRRNSMTLIAFEIGACLTE